MPSVRPWIALRTYMSVDTGNPALLKAQYRAFARQIPLMYVMLMINAWLLASTHLHLAPRWLTLYLPAAMSLVCLSRCITWWRSDPDRANVETARNALRRTNILAWPITGVFICWSLLLFPYGDSHTQSHVAFFMAVTVIGVLLCLMHVRPAMLVTAASVNGIFVVFFIASGVPTFTAMAINVALVTTTLVIMLLRQYDDFVLLVRSREQAEVLGAENLRLANLDSLTGLPNRRWFFATLDAECADAEAEGARFAVGILDLDGFKPVNDLYGHAVGDRLLAQVGERLAALRSAHVHFARLGGDEFALIIRDMAGDEDSIAFGRQVCEELRRPFVLHDTTLQIAASMGMVIYPDLAADAVDLYERADYALYHGKRNHPGSVSLFSTRLRDQIQRDALIEQALRKAELDQELSVHFQPIVDAPRHRTLAFEALARWTHPALGDVPPSRFIPIAERAGLISHLTRSVLRKALAAAKAWPDGIGLSLNLSAHDLGSNEEVLRLVALIGASGVAAHRIDLEITETAVMHDMEQVQWAVRQLRDLGCGVTLDDFGTGFSSLSQLHALPLTRIKIDQRFVSGIHHNPTSLKIVKSLLALSRDMGLACVIEGVETQEELAVLTDLGGNTMQGYLFSPPLPAEAIPAWLASAPGDRDGTPACTLW